MITGMASKKKPHRNQKFRQLLRDMFNNNQKEMADAIELAPSLISRYAKDKGIGEDVRIHIENILGLGDGWFDTETNEVKIKNDDGLLRMLNVPLEGLSMPMALKLAEFLRGTPEQQDHALALIREEQTNRGKDAGNGGEGK